MVEVLCALVMMMTGTAAADTDDALFTNGVVRRIQITIPPESLADLRANPREHIRATVREGSNTWAAGVHVKGSVGSFRSIDGKPSLTLSFDRLGATQRFHGLRKIHLNNSVEDPSYMNELLGNDLFREAGVPAPRVTHAIVELNERRLGLYVLKEGFTEEFLARYFRHPDGNLYDIAKDGHDVNEPLVKAFGKGPDDRQDLDVLAAAAQQPDLALRWKQLQATLDVEHFLSFMAMEILLGHRDGYCLARNNFRVYRDVDSNRILFFPQGMDVLFGNPRAPLQPVMNGLVARALMETPEGRKAYRARCSFLATNVLTPKRIGSIIERTLPPLRTTLNAEELAALDKEVTSLKQRVADRLADIERQLQQTPMQPLHFENDAALVTGWQAVDVPEGGNLTQIRIDGKPALAVVAGPVTSASWRAKVLLPRGRYRFEGSAKTSAVAALPFGKHHGAMLRVPGLSGSRSQALLGDNPWTRLAVSFEVRDRDQEVELICELRAHAGSAWFDPASLQIIRLK